MKEKISWKTLSPIFADVVVSPWNLIIGGIVSAAVGLPLGLISLLIGYIVLGGLFYFYGGLGFDLRKKTSELIEPIFGEQGTKLFFSSILALGQIGWFAIINQIGGESLSDIFGVPAFVGIIGYAIIMYFFANLKLVKLGIIKFLIIIASVSLIVFLVSTNLDLFQLSNITRLPEGLSSEEIFTNLLLGVSLTTASLISFVSVSPDFTYNLSTKRDLSLSVILGIIIPGFITTGVGAIVFSGVNEVDLGLIIGVSSFSLLGNIFNITTNTDASQAIFTPANRISYIFGFNFSFSLLIATVIGTVFSLLDITSFIESWLSVLVGIYPGLIGLAIAHYLLLKDVDNKMKSLVKSWQSISIIILCSTLIFILNISLLNWVVGLTAFILYIVMVGIDIQIYIGKDKGL